MIKRQIWVFLGMIVSITAATGLAQRARYSSVRNPAADRSAVSGARVGGRRVPPASRLAPMPRPDLQYGNRIISGDVAGGRHFRDTVPYFSASRFSSPLTDTGSQSVSSFVRRSAGNPFSAASRGQTYYDPRQTVTSLRRDGQSGLTPPQWLPQTTIRDHALTQPQIPQGMLYSAQPISTVSAEMERIINQQRGLRQLALEYDMLRQQQTDTTTAEPDRRYLTDPVQRRALDEILTPVKPAEPVEPDPIKRQQQAQIEKIHKELLAALMEVEEPAEEPIAETPTESQSTAESMATGAPTTTPRSPAAQAAADNTQVATTTTPGTVGTARTTSGGVVFSGDPLETRRRALAILGEHKDFQSLADAKFRGYAEQAEQYLRDGRFYKAADTYALALVWHDDDPQAYFGQGTALFAAGSYLSSYYSFAAALKLDPDAALADHDVPALIGGRDTFEDALIELEKWQGTTDSAELAWLMAYMYYLDGKPDNAKLALEMAQAKLGDTDVFKQLHQALNAAQPPTP